MLLRKKHLKTRPVCRVSFLLPAGESEACAAANLVGEFNGWNPTATPMKRNRDGSFSVTLDLQSGRDYAYLYLLDGQTWKSDPEADHYAYCAFACRDNSVVRV